MSKRRDIEASLRSLGEIRDILNAMKNMARMEVHRLGRFLVTQQRVVAGVEAAGSDFRQFHPELFPQNEPSREVHLLVGSERGFCGDFNESLLRALHRRAVPGQAEPGEATRDESAQVVVLGSKLAGKLPPGFRAAVVLESASVVEEVEGVLVRLMNTLSSLGDPARPLRVTVFHHEPQHDVQAHEQGGHKQGGHEPEGEDVRVSILRPFQEVPAGPARFAYPPHLYLDPVAFANGLVEQYLFARLHELLYSSLMVENQVRVQHMDSAVQRLEKKSAELLRRRNVLRQEEITEEIEVIMLSADTIA